MRPLPITFNTALSTDCQTQNVNTSLGWGRSGERGGGVKRVEEGEGVGDNGYGQSLGLREGGVIWRVWEEGGRG